jgi:hypothetical protein
MLPSSILFTVDSIPFHLLNFIILNIILLNAILLNAILLNFSQLHVLLPKVIFLNIFLSNAFDVKNVALRLPDKFDTNLRGQRSHRRRRG